MGCIKAVTTAAVPCAGVLYRFVFPAIQAMTKVKATIAKKAVEVPKKPLITQKQAEALAKLKGKPLDWILAKPKGCHKCREVPGCTPSCWRGKTKR